MIRRIEYGRDARARVRGRVDAAISPDGET